MTVPTSYSVEQYAAALRGPGPDGTPESVEYFKVRWLERRLRGEAEPKLPGFKAGGRWRGTAQDIAAAIELLRPKQTSPPIPNVSSMSRTTRRRLGL